jgi:hypothetical protein
LILSKATLTACDLINLQLSIPPIKLNEMAMPAMLVTAEMQRGIFSKTAIEKAFKFCNYECHAFSWLDYNQKSGNKISPQYFQLWNGSCHDTINTPQYSKLASTPPTTLT